MTELQTPEPENSQEPPKIEPYPVDAKTYAATFTDEEDVRFDVQLKRISETVYIEDYNNKVVHKSIATEESKRTKPVVEDRAALIHLFVQHIRTEHGTAADTEGTQTLTLEQIRDLAENSPYAVVGLTRNYINVEAHVIQDRTSRFAKYLMPLAELRVQTEFGDKKQYKPVFTMKRLSYEKQSILSDALASIEQEASEDGRTKKQKVTTFVERDLETVFRLFKEHFESAEGCVFRGEPYSDNHELNNPFARKPLFRFTFLSG